MYVPMYYNIFYTVNGGDKCTKTHGRRYLYNNIYYYIIYIRTVIYTKVDIIAGVRVNYRDLNYNYSGNYRRPESVRTP